MKPSERIRRRIQEIQNNVYYRLTPGMRKRVNKAYRLKKNAAPKVKTRSQIGHQELKRQILRSSEGLRRWTHREMGENTPRRRRRRVVVGK